MLFRKKPPAPQPHPGPEPAPEPRVPAPVMDLLQRLEKAGVQLLVRPGGPDEYTSEVVGLGTDAFFIDTLSPPEGDGRLRAGARVQIETLVQGVTYTFRTVSQGKVQFVDELPALKLEYPTEVNGERRRKSPRVDTRGGASLSFLKPFACDAPVVNLSVGGMAFEYAADLGRFKVGAIVPDVLLELGSHPVLRVQGRVVGNLVVELGGISLPRRYRTSLSFQDLAPKHLEQIRSYLEELKAVNVSV
ncbi:MAG TPA: PilZ domain-containing protein [Deferrisomatales bacterium]|nr:PilZ domain-containing protein [Deferrisomatales bacterium]